MANRGTPDERLRDAKQGVAILVTCLVQELEAMNPGFTEHYLRRLGRAYTEVREDNTPALDRLELINWTRELLTGFNQVTGQGKIFLED